MMTQVLGPVLVTAGFLLATPAAACSGYGLSVAQVGGGDYEATGSSVAIVLELSAVGGAQPSACSSVPVTITGAGLDAEPLTLLRSGSRLVGALEPGPEAGRSGPTLALTAESRSRLVQGQPVTVQIGVLNAGQFVRSGAYTATFIASAGNSSQSFELQSEVQPVLLLQSSSADGQEVIEFAGDLQRGASGSTVYFYRSNADLNVTVASQNSGRLVHERGRTFGSVPYTVTFDGQALDLTGPAQTLDFDFQGLDLQSRTIDVVVPAPDPQFAGRFEDVITLSFWPY